MTQKVILVAGLGFGDEGKGSIVDYLTRTTGATTIVRYNGGAQAAHNVVTSDGRHHLFAQFGSGTFVPGVKTHLSRFMVVNPMSLLVEEEHLQKVGVTDALSRLTVDRDAPIVTPIQKEMNRYRELLRGPLRHGSCGVGIGETVRDSQKHPDATLYAKDLCDPNSIRKKMMALVKIKRQEFIGNLIPEPLYPFLEFPYHTLERCVEQYMNFAKRVAIVDGVAHMTSSMRKGETCIFEGAQGVLLDVNHGFIPYHTKTDMTFANAFALLEEAGYGGKIERVGVLRGYHSRHGAGPFPTEDTTLFEALRDEHNATNEWQGNFRVGYFDAVLARYARDIIDDVDYLAVTNLDRMQNVEKKICLSYVTPSRNEQYFSYRGDTAHGIMVNNSRDANHQKELTRLMVGVTPQYHVASTLYAYAHDIEGASGMSVKLLSFGPTADDKIIIE